MDCSFVFSTPSFQAVTDQYGSGAWQDSSHEIRVPKCMANEFYVGQKRRLTDS